MAKKAINPYLLDFLQKNAIMAVDLDAEKPICIPWI